MSLCSVGIVAADFRDACVFDMEEECRFGTQIKTRRQRAADEPLIRSIEYSHDFQALENVGKMQGKRPHSSACLPPLANEKKTGILP